MPTFTASDGTNFSDRRAYRKYEFELSFTFRAKSGTAEAPLVLVKEPGSIGGQPFELENLEHCEVLLLDHTEAIQCDNLTNCRCDVPLFILPLLPRAGSFFTVYPAGATYRFLFSRSCLVLAPSLPCTQRHLRSTTQGPHRGVL